MGLQHRMDLPQQQQEEEEEQQEEQEGQELLQV